MPSVAELAKTIGKRGFVSFGDLCIAVTVTDARTRFGGIDYLVQPDLPSSGSQWISESRFIQS